jgi:hypothetical protein
MEALQAGYLDPNLDLNLNQSAIAAKQLATNRIFLSGGHCLHKK